MRRFSASAVILFLAVIPRLSAEYNPPDGGEALYELVSPLFLAGGPSLVSQESPTADALNPAASALQQRTTIDAGYIGLADISDDGWKGHAANIGGTLPTRYGVFSGSLQFLTTSLNDMDLGTQGIARFSFAKDLFPNLLVGTGLNLTLGSRDSFDYGISADLGFIHFPEDGFGLDDFRWGAVLRNAGKWYSPVDGRSAFPSPFTPAVGAGFTVYRSPGGVALGLTGDAAFPTVQNIRLSLGADLSYRDRFSLHGGMRLDLQQVFNDDLALRSMIPSFGITAVFRTDFKDKESFIGERGWDRSDVKTRAAAAPLHGGIWAFGTGLNINLGVVDRNPPRIVIDYPGEKYISPNLDGKDDVLEFPVSLRDERYIMEYRFVIKDDSGTPVRIIENKEKRPENESFRSVVDRLLYVKSGIGVPDTFRWDGIGDSGSLVPDGRYSFVIEAKDDNGNLAVSAPRSFVIDTTPPAVEIAVPRGSDLIFSPNDDGFKDTLRIVQEGSPEDFWEAEILDASGTLVRTHSWKNDSPGTIVWDGKNDKGDLVPDGVYSYRISSTDRAGNRTETGFDNIIISTEPTPVSLSIDTSYFSPNGDGVKDTVTISPVIPVTFGLESWEVTIVDSRGTLMRRYHGLLNAPLPIEFDGHMESGTRLPEGSYLARLQVIYRNGNRPQAESPAFFVDLTKPQAVLRSDFTVFSPNGDGSRDEITFFQESSREERWTGTVKNAESRPVRTFSWIEKADSSITWNGRSDAGTLVPDGTYTYQIESVDRAGNRGVSNVVTFTINTEETPVILSADLDAFSPNGDGVKDVIRLTPTVKVAEGIESFALNIRDDSGRNVRTFSGRLRLDPYFVWDGLSQDGSRAPDGMYAAEIAVLYVNGNRSTSKAGPFELDTRPPEITVSVDYTVFSPDGDGYRDEVNFTQKSSSEALWEGRILNSLGAEVRNFFWKGEAGDFTWDGTDKMGNRVPDGYYSYVVHSEDRAGNRARREIRNILSDSRPVSAFVTVDGPGFSPNGDGIRDTTEFTLYLNLLEGLESWSLAVKDSAGVTRKNFSGTTFTSPLRIRWDGLGDDGSVKEGLYYAEFESRFTKGNRPVARSGQFLLDVTPPRVDLTLNPLPFSPDNDGIDDELTISLSVKDESAIADWSFVIYDRNERIFNQFSGKGMPTDRIVWDGRSQAGELVIAAEDYSYIFTVSDSLGNTRQVKGIIPIDILVIREGDRLKIKISSINFSPNSPEVILDDSDTGRKNISTLKRLVEVLTKYGNYQILIEGHANNISGTQREETEELGPLSLSRAVEVRKALISFGLSGRRVDAAGKGGREMLFPFSDRENNWKNRRVEFILIK